MTDNEIIKALEICGCEDRKCSDNACPLLDKCKEDLHTMEKEALALINRQRVEIKKYRNRNQAQKSELTRLYQKVTEQKAEIEKWQNSYYKLATILNEKVPELMKEMTQLTGIRNEAIKEFAERLKEESKSGFEYWVTVDDIDNLVKEMIGETK